MIGESSETSTVSPPQARASVLITLNVPGSEPQICRLSNSEEVIRDLSVRELIKRVISPNSLFSIGVPMSQLQAEGATASAIGELLNADCCEVVLPGKGNAGEKTISLDEAVRDVADEQVGSQGNRFLNIHLEIRSAPDSAAPTGDERRTLQAPSTLEVETKKPILTGRAYEEPRKLSVPSKSHPAAFGAVRVSEPTKETVTQVDSPTSNGMPESGTSPTDSTDMVEESPRIGEASTLPVAEPSTQVEEAKPKTEESEKAPSQASSNILTIVAETPKDAPKEESKERKEYVRKSDWLRAQFLPEVEVLDFSGLFVGNLGMGIREEKGRRNVVLADPSRITEVLLRANGYRRNGDHPKALICYQELVDMDPANSDFRFLLGRTLLALGQREDASEAFLRAKELGHDGADRELANLKKSGHRPQAPLGFLRFWKQ